MVLAVIDLHVSDDEWDTTEVIASRRTHDGVDYAGSEVRPMDGSGRALENWRGTVYGTQSTVALGAQGVGSVNWESGEHMTRTNGVCLSPNTLGPGMVQGDGGE